MRNIAEGGRMRTEIKTSESTTYLCEKCGAKSNSKVAMKTHEKMCTVVEDREKYVGKYVNLPMSGCARIMSVEYNTHYDCEDFKCMFLESGDVRIRSSSAIHGEKICNQDEVDEIVEKMKKECCDRIDANYAKLKKVM